MLWLVLVACSPLDRTPIDAADSGAATPPPPGAAPAEGRCAHGPDLDWLSEPAREPLADGDPVVLVNGPQGGWHVGVNAGVRGARELWMGATLTGPDGATLSVDDPPTAVRLYGWDPESCEGLLTGLQARLVERDRAAICALAGTRLRLSVEVEDLYTGVQGSRTVEVVATSDPHDGC